LSILDTKIEFLKGVGPARSLLLNKDLSIYSFYDLLNFFPFRYVDRSKFYKINQIIHFDADIQLIGTVINKQTIGIGRKKRLVVNFKDDSGIVELIFFKGIRWVSKYIQLGKDYVIFGRPSNYAQKISFVHPEVDLLDDRSHRIKHAIHPVYHSTEKLSAVGLNSKGISKLIDCLLRSVDKSLVENLSSEIVLRHNLLNRKLSFNNLHFPSTMILLKRSIFRLKFEELFFLQLSVLKQNRIRKNRIKSFVFTKVGDSFNNFFSNHLNFELTTAQKRVIKEIRLDTLSGFQMNRLLQGDVGSGKTIVAIMSMLLAHDNGYQSCLMAPTEILANQHFDNLKMFAKHLNLNIALLTGKIKPSIKKEILHKLASGSTNIIVGTHALVGDSVVFSKLGLAIIDEQHKFGVAQRSSLWQKNNKYPHVLVMTATPIPRTLAMTAYGNLDVSVIDELPPNRKPVLTLHKYDKAIKQVYHFVNKELVKGKQVYIVYPLIEESASLDYKNLMDGYATIKEIFKNSDFNISVMHGRLKKEEKQLEMIKFLNKDTQIMIATTVIEVGVNVPNATTMVVQNAEKFGLSQLHQLRGRVGRGEDKSYCFLLTSNKLTRDAKVRIKAMVDSNDGFEIADVDLKLRGPGDVLGTRQSGLLNLKLSSLVKDVEILNSARLEVNKILDIDIDLLSKSNIGMKFYFDKYFSKSLKWGSVS
jgi:ATP-dependent DNA helicase RecG